MPFTPDHERAIEEPATTVSIEEVYIVKHRLSAQLKEEVALLEKSH